MRATTRTLCCSWHARKARTGHSSRQTVVSGQQHGVQSFDTVMPLLRTLWITSTSKPLLTSVAQSFAAEVTQSICGHDITASSFSVIP